MKNLFILLFCLLTSICFAQTTWEFKKEIDQEIDMAGKFRVRVLIANGTDEQVIMLKFQKQPTQKEISTESAKICYILNNPSPQEKTIEELKQTIVEKDKIITGLTSKVEVR